MRLEELDEALRGLPVHDVSPGRMERMRAACVAALAAGAGRGRAGGTAGHYWEALEPLAALGASALYLAAALRAATVLLLLR